jgi:hypothetical protein
MKKYLFLTIFLVLFAACGGGAPADLFPATVGSFHLKGSPKAWGSADKRMFDAEYESSDGKSVKCHGMSATYPQEADKYVAESGPVNDADQIKPYTDKSGKVAGKKILGVWEDSVWALRWSNGSNAYRCLNTSSDSQNILEDFDKNWPSK